jgi:hypothetical protein
MDGDGNRADEWTIFKSIIVIRGADWVMTRPKISWLFVLSAINIPSVKCTRSAAGPQSTKS